MCKKYLRTLNVEYRGYKLYAVEGKDGKDMDLVVAIHADTEHEIGRAQSVDSAKSFIDVYLEEVKEKK